MGVKIWWHWVIHKEESWEKLWHNKYVSRKPKQHLIGFNEGRKGSHIWNHANLNREIIQDQSFWEIQEGHDANIWNDSWQQIPKIFTQIYIQESKEKVEEMGLIKVHQFLR